MHRNQLNLPCGKETVTLNYGEVPMGESVELLVLRKGLARELLSGGKIGEPSTHVYYEVYTTPKLYELVAALPRTKHAAMELSAPKQRADTCTAGCACIHFVAPVGVLRCAC